MPVIPHEALTGFCRQILTGAGVREDHAGLTATMLVAANLRGIDSHGVQLLGFYVDQILGGDMQPRAEGTVASESGATMVYDCQGGLGQVTSAHASDHAIRLAKQHGLGAVTAREGNHFGAAFWWARRMAEQGMIGMVMCNASSLVPPWQGREPRFGTNPICMALPGEDSAIFATMEHKPDFGVLVYPVISLDESWAHRGSSDILLGSKATPEQRQRLSTNLLVTDHTPPTFLVATQDDTGVPCRNAMAFYQAMCDHKVPGELHIWDKGGHGFGILPGRGDVVTEWPQRLAKWMAGRGLLKK